jgi:hypothetical protein
MQYEFGAIVLVPFPFTDQSASKRRPTFIVSGRAYNAAKPDVVVMAVTSQLRALPAMGEVWIGDWRPAGLLKPSAIKPGVRHERAAPRYSSARAPSAHRSGGTEEGYQRDNRVERGTSRDANRLVSISSCFNSDLCSFGKAMASLRSMPAIPADYGE